MTEQSQQRRVSVLEADDTITEEGLAGSPISDTPRSGGIPAAAVVLVPVALLAVGGYLLFKGLSRERPVVLERQQSTRQAELPKAPPKIGPTTPSEPPAGKTVERPAPQNGQPRTLDTAIGADAPKAPGEPVSSEPARRSASDAAENKGTVEKSGPEAEHGTLPATPPVAVEKDPDGETAGLAALTREIEADYSLVEAWKKRAHVYLTHKRHAESIADYDMAVALDPLQALSFNDRGIVHFQMGNHERARNDFNWALMLDPDETLAIFNRGLLHFETNENAASDRDFTAFLEKVPDDAEAWRWRGQARFRLGRHQAAFDDFTQALSLADSDALSLAYRCSASLMLDNVDVAERDCDAAIKLDGKLGEALNNLAWIRYKRGQHRAGLALAERALKANPDHENSLDTRGHLLEALGERQLARADYRAALQRNPQQSESIDGLKRLGATP